MAGPNRLPVLGAVGAFVCVVAGGGWWVYHHKPTLSPPPALSATLGPSWTMVPLPNSGLSPGAIVQVVPRGGGSASAAGALDLRWLGRLEDCGVPGSALVVNDATVPAISSGSTYAIDASLGASLAGVSGELGANADSTADFTIAKSTDSTLNFVGFEGWVGVPDNAAQLAEHCGQIMGSPGVYVVQEAFIVSQGSYTFKNKQGGTLAVKPPAGAPVKLSTNASTGDTGALTITSPTVFALKVLQSVPKGGFRVAFLDSPTPQPPPPMTAPPPPPPPAVVASAAPTRLSSAVQAHELHAHTRPSASREPMGEAAPPPAPPPPPVPVASAPPPPPAPPPVSTKLLLGGKTIGSVEGIAHPHP